MLIVTQRFDPHADVVEAALTRIGVPALRLNTEDFHAYSVNWSSDEPGLRLGSMTGQVIDMSRVAGCYFRRPLPVPAHPDLEASQAQAFSASEAKAFLGGLYALPEVRWFSHPAALQRAGAKIGQLSVARRLGFAVPRTLVTNDTEAALEFARGLGAGIVVKPLQTAFIESGSSRIEFFARQLSPSDAIRASQYIRFAPTLLQEYMPKCSEVRVTVMGRQIFAVEITPVSADPPLDWTSMDPSDFSYEQCSIPGKLKRMIQKFLEWYGLRFGAFDFLKMADGDLVFLENNPNGAWHWLERQTGLPMADSMARLLAGRSDVE